MKNNKLDIAILCISDNFAGAERVVYHLINRLYRLKKINLHLITNEEIFENYSQLKCVKIHNIGKCFGGNVFSRHLLNNKARRKVKNILLSEKFDLINTHMVSPLYFYYLFKKLHTPYIVTLHGDDIKYYLSPENAFHRFIYRPLVKQVYKGAISITSVCSFLLGGLEKELFNKTIVIGNGVDSKLFKPLKNIKEAEKIILYSGRYIERKGFKELINVARQLPQYEFWFAGQGELANLINLPNTKNLGFKPTKGLIKSYNQATICIFPSYWEALPLCGLEAMSCQKAVIATPLGFSEYIENGKDGIIIPTKNEKALKDAIVDLMENPKKRKMIEKNARKKALKYSWDKVAKQYLKVFMEIIK